MSARAFFVAALAATTSLVGCAGPVTRIDRMSVADIDEDELKRAASGIVGCKPQNITIDDASHAQFHDVWLLSCRSGRWVCSRQDLPMQEYLNCALLADGVRLGHD